MEMREHGRKACAESALAGVDRRIRLSNDGMMFLSNPFSVWINSFCLFAPHLHRFGVEILAGRHCGIFNPGFYLGFTHCHRCHKIFSPKPTAPFTTFVGLKYREPKMASHDLRAGSAKHRCLYSIITWAFLTKNMGAC
jgi:hypothetical protein